MTGLVQPTTAEVWLSTPEAAAQLDPSQLSSSDLKTWSGLHTSRRRMDWASSRVLLGALSSGGDCASSLSHSHGYAAVARTLRPVAVGVDLEWMAPRDFLSIASIAFSASEHAHLAAIADASVRRARFYEYWTLKEAFAKALELPLQDALQRCCFAGSETSDRATVLTSLPWCASVFAPRPQLRLAVVHVARTRLALPTMLATHELSQGAVSSWHRVLDLRPVGEPTDGAC